MTNDKAGEVQARWISWTSVSRFWAPAHNYLMDLGG